jgi:catechol 2,3-dioxygenase-like lactoylglutathione lyase family enzyme
MSNTGDKWRAPSQPSDGSACNGAHYVSQADSSLNQPRRCCIEIMGMSPSSVLRMVDAVTVSVPDLDQGLAFYRDRLGHDLIWRNDDVGQAGLRLPDSETEIVLSRSLPYAPNWLVSSVPEAVADIVAAGGSVVVEPRGIAVGRMAVVADPFGNSLILVDLSNGRYATDDTGRVTGVEPVHTGDGP